MKPRPAALAAVFAALLCSLPASARAPAETLEATWGASCAPWDGAALAVTFESLGLHVMIYGPDMARFRAGKRISIKAKPEREGDTATLLTPRERVRFRGVAAELRLDPKTGKGTLRLDGVVHPVRFKEDKSGPPFCG
jgi:hypothetical protein